MDVELVEALTPEQVNDARRLFREYQSSLDVDLCFQSFEEELASLPGAYARPRGRLFIAMRGDEAVGCIALRPLSGSVCEMKRLYVKASMRGTGLGRRLAMRVIEDARGIGYSVLRLDTLPSMTEAIALYRRLGFVEIAPYCVNPVPGARFLELGL
jgi:ribosomal protein S18 acetylase RimI-like enzyme